MTEVRKGWLVLAVMMYIAYIATMWKWGHDDIYFWKNWSIYIYTNGFTHIYDTAICNYLPAYLYIIYLNNKIQGSLSNIQDNLYVLKFYTLVFDMLGAYAAVWFVKDEYKKVFYFLLLMLNIAYIYNTVFWGQVDAIFTFWGFAAVIAAIERKVVWSMLLLLISLNFKVQGLVFVPVIGLLLLPQLLSRKGIQKIAIGFISCILLQILILYPFIVKGNLNKVIGVFTSYVDSYPYTNVGSFNFWSWLVPVKEGVPPESDAKIFIFLTYKQIGKLMFILAVLVAVIPLMKHLYKKYIQEQSISFPLEKIFLISSLTPLVFYFFNTQMHERYSHPALISLAAYTFCTRRYGPLVLGSLAYFLNMEKIFRYLAWTNYGTLIFQPAFVAGVYFTLIIYLYYLLYSKPAVVANYWQPEI